MTTFKTLKTAALSVALGFGAITIAPTASDAMVIYNCTDDHLPVSVIHVPSGRQFGTSTLAPGKGASWDTGRGTGFRVSINVIGPDKRFSNRSGSETISMMKISGNTELVTGKKCSQQTNNGSYKSKSKGKSDLLERVAETLIDELLKN